MNPFQIYVFLYLWFVFLAAVSGIWLVYRILTIFSHQVGLGTVPFFTPILSRNLAKNKWYASAEYQKYDVKERHYVHVSHAPNDCRWEWTWSTQEQIAKWTRMSSTLVSPRMTTGSFHNCNVFHYYVGWEVFVSTIVNQPWPKSLSWSVGVQTILYDNVDTTIFKLTSIITAALSVWETSYFSTKSPRTSTHSSSRTSLR